MEKRNLGNTGTKVGALGIGAMSFSDFYGPTNTQESHAILKMALDNGIAVSYTHLTLPTKRIV